MRRVCVVVTARPTYSRIRSALHAIEAHPDLELDLVVAGSALLDRYGRAVDVIEADGFRVAARVSMVLEGEDPRAMSKTTGLGILELSTVFENLAPDAVVTVADRYETMATAVAASYQNLPLVHVQGGEVSGSIDEKVRHAVTKLADLHLVATDGAAERVRRMGERPETVLVTGCPSIDLAAEVAGSTELGFDPVERYGGVGAELHVGDDGPGYVVVLQHPVTTEHDHARDQITEVLAAVSACGLPALWFWPNVDAGSDGTSNGIRRFREQHHDEAPIRFFKNMAPLDFLRLIAHGRALVGNSSVGIREGSYLGVPTVNVGGRQRDRERGPNVVDVGYGRDEIADGLARQLAHGRYPGTDLYGDGRSGARIAEVLAEAPLSIDKRLAY